MTRRRTRVAPNPRMMASLSSLSRAFHGSPLADMTGALHRKNQRPSKPAARLQPGAGLVNYRTASALTGESLLHVGTLSKSDRRVLLDAAAGGWVGEGAERPKRRPKSVEKYCRIRDGVEGLACALSASAKQRARTLLG